jgi:hypothetical protein
MMYPDSVTVRQTVLEPLRRVLAYRLSREMVTMAVDAHIVEIMADRIVLDVVAKVHAHALPPAEVIHHVRLEVDDPRHASWWDMFKDAYAQRWWMRWRAWPVHYVQTKVAVQREVAVAIRGHWTYPDAPIPASKMGQPVVVATWDTSDRPW